MTPVKDRQIQAAVLDELHEDPQLTDTLIGVEVDDGWVTLEGSVDSTSQRVAATIDAHHVSGVIRVVDDLTVRTPLDPTNILFECDALEAVDFQPVEE